MLKNHKLPYLIFLLFVVLFQTNISSSSAQEKIFKNKQIAYGAKLFQKKLQQTWERTHRKRWNDQKKSYQDWITTAQQAKSNGNTSLAQEAFWAALILDPQNVSNWLELGQGYANIQLSKDKKKERRRFTRTATSASYLAYTLAKRPENKIKALSVLAKALMQRSYWRPALEAYKASLSLKEDPKIRSAYNELNGQHGFRVTNYKVDTETENPRVCIQFSETLANGKINFAKYITLNGKDPSAVTREDRQLCLDGLIHGQRYEVKVRAGLPAKIDEAITKTANLKVYVRDRSPAVRASGKTYVLPKTGQNGIPLISVNTKKLKVEVHNIGDRALSQTMVKGYLGRQFNHYNIEQLKKNLSRKIWSGEMDVKSQLNKDVTTAFPAHDVIKDIQPGLYVLYASPAETKKGRAHQGRASQWFVVSDLGLTSLSSPEGMHVFVRSLASAEPLSNVAVKVLARNNEILGQVKTDNNGHAKFSKGLINGEGSQAPFLVVAEGENASDYAFLDITKAAFDLSDRGVSGRKTAGPLDAYLYVERGVYRSGEQVYLTGLLRDDKGLAVPKLPLTLIIRRPDGKEHNRIIWQDEGAGGRSHIIDLQNSAMSGTWHVQAYIDPEQEPVGNTSFLVEDYNPQRLELELKPNIDNISVTDTAEIALTGRYLYGAPAANLQLNGEVLVQKSTQGLKGFKGYHFGLHDETFLPVNTPFNTLPRTNQDGKAQIPVALTELTSTNIPLEAEVTLRMTEPGGKAIAEQVRLNIKPTQPALGIKPLFKSGQLGQRTNAQFEIVSVDKTGKQSTLKNLKWEIFEIQRRYQWYNRNGSWNYESIEYTKKVGDGTLETKADGPAIISTAVQSGQYRLDVSSENTNGPVSSHLFSSGWYGSSNADTPDLLNIAFDKPTYKAGETLTVTIKSETVGKALVAIIDTDIRKIKLVDVNEANTNVDFKVGEDWGPGTYVTAFFYRPMDTKTKRMPSRSIGINWLPQSKESNKLKVSIDIPEKTRPNTTLNVPVKIDGLKANSKTYVTLSAVDEGILSLTEYKSPNPKTWYYGQRRFRTEIRDLYGKLIDGMQAVRGKIRSGGDGLARLSSVGLKSEAPKNVEPIALYSGIVAVDPDGKVNIPLKLPAFDGTLRLMMVAWNETQIGNAEQDIIVRDPVVLIGTAPRFLTIGDQSNLHLSFNNIEGPDGEFSIQIEPSGPVDVDMKLKEQTLRLEKSGHSMLSIPITAKNKTGTAQLKLKVKGPDEFILERSFAFNVHPGAPNVTRRFALDVKPNGGQVSFTKDLVSGLATDTVKVSVNVNQGAVFDVPGLLLALDQYPYGCAEQTTSRALPLLYMSSVAKASGLIKDSDVKTRIEMAVNHLSSMQMSNGAFGLWGPFNQDLWLTAYVADFLTRAKAQGHNVSQQTFELAIDRLQNAISYASDFKNGGEGLAYALYVLARNGRAGIGDLRYYLDTKLDDFATSLAQAQLGSALAMYGDKARAEEAYGAALKRLNPKYEDKDYRKDYGSRLRDGAAMLTLVSETPVTNRFIPEINDILASASQSQDFTSTQENAWLLLAAHALQKQAKNLKMLVNGKPHSGALQRVMTADQFSTKDITVTNQTDKLLKAVVSVMGDGKNPEPALAKGFRIERQIYTLDGQLTSLEKVTQNDRFVVVLSVDEEEAKRGRLILVDRLPAGFEIENPRLVNSSSTKQLAWLKTKGRVEHTEFKDDKFVAAFNVAPNSKKTPQSLSVAYIMRAVSPGAYLHPSAKIEDMYRPGRFARTSATRVEVQKSN
ncbi:MAG: alpha-2-macroglobulin [Pseudomonadota bacterium]